MATGNEFPLLCIDEAYSRCKNSFSPCLLFTTRSIPPGFHLHHGPLKCYSAHSSTSALSPSLITTTSSHSRRFCAVLTSYGEAQRCACSLASSAAQACGGRCGVSFNNFGQTGEKRTAMGDEQVTAILMGCRCLRGKVNWNSFGVDITET